MLQTQSLARQIYNQYWGQIGNKALIIALEGPLGVGKTTFVKALAQAMDIQEAVVSPTFILHRGYNLLDHIDLWRIEDPQELTALGLEKMVQEKKVIVIEWAEKARSLILGFQPQARVIWIKFNYGKKEDERRISYEDFSH